MKRRLLNKSFIKNGNKLESYWEIGSVFCDEKTNYVFINFSLHLNYRIIKHYYLGKETEEVSLLNNYITIPDKDSCKYKITTDIIENLNNHSDKRLVFFKETILNQILSYKKYKDLIPSWYIHANNINHFLPTHSKIDKQSEIFLLNYDLNTLEFYRTVDAIFVDFNNTSGCYIIWNTELNKYYVGQSTNIEKRFKSHFDYIIPKNPIFLEDYYNSKTKNKNDIFKICFIFVDDWNRLNDLEIKLISLFDSTNKNSGYNTDFGGKSNQKLKKIQSENRKVFNKLHYLKDELLKLDYIEQIDSKTMAKCFNNKNYDDNSVAKQLIKKMYDEKKENNTSKRIELLNQIADIVIESDIFD